MRLQMRQGYFAAGDPYFCHYDEMIEGTECKVKIINDTLLYDHSIKQHFVHVWDYLTLCAKNGIIIHAKKFQFCNDTGNLPGLNITPDGVSLLKIRHLPLLTFLSLPTLQAHVHGLARFHGAYGVSPILMQPFRDLIKPN